MKLGNIFDSIPDKLDKEVFELIVKKNKVRIERIVSKGHSSPESGWYDQSHDEWVIVLKGEAVISFEDGEDIGLKEGSYANIPAHIKHKVRWTDPNMETVWLAVHY